MRYIKKFEKKQKPEPKYQVGDYVLVYSEFESIFNAVMKIESMWYDGKKKIEFLVYDCEYIGGGDVREGLPGCGISEKEIVKKLEPHEIDFYLDAKKYNL
jgi:hypothetical protein